MKNIFITGKPGCGKTTLIRNLADALPRGSISGFYTGEVRKSGQRVGFSISTFDGYNKTLAHINHSSKIRVGKYFVNVAATDEIIQHLCKPPNPEIRLYLVDEIGKMESFSGAFRQWIEELLSGPVPVIATIALRGNEWIESVKNRADVELWELTPANRDYLLPQLLQRVRSMMNAKCNE